MDEVKEKQLKVEKVYLNSNKPFPATWNWEENEKGLFYIEPTTNRKRYGVMQACECCERNFIVRHDWVSNVTCCSKVCASLLREDKVKTSCAWCKKEIAKTQSKLNNSKHGLHFCDRKCKEEAQQIGGLELIQPEHYKDGSASYSDRAFRHYGEKCCDCGLNFRPLLSVHHIDGNRDNGSIENLEVVCSLHHDLRHMYFDEKEKIWVFNTKSLTPRNKLDELRKLLST